MRLRAEASCNIRECPLHLKKGGPCAASVVWQGSRAARGVYSLTALLALTLLGRGTPGGNWLATA